MKLTGIVTAISSSRKGIAIDGKWFNYPQVDKELLHKQVACEAEGKNITKLLITAQSSTSGNQAKADDAQKPSFLTNEERKLAFEQLKQKHIIREACLKAAIEWFRENRGAVTYEGLIINSAKVRGMGA